jgi:methyl-accepting chemotaxis protein
VNKLKVSTRLMLLVGLFAVMLVSIGATGLVGIRQTNESLRTVYEDRTVPAADLGEIRALVLHNRVGVNAALVTATPEEVKVRAEEIERNIASISKVWDAYMKTMLTAEEARLAQQFTQERQAFVNEGLRPIIAAMRAGDFERARKLVPEKLRPLAGPMEQRLDALVKLQIDVARDEYQAAEARFAVIQWSMFAAIGLGLALGCVAGLLIVRGIGRQLGGEPAAAAELVQRVATGDLAVRIELRPGDESSLMANLKRMQDSLVGVVSRVRDNADSVSSASTQIAQGNQDLSSRTEEQASALQQTASSMEQLSAAVRHNAENATQANQLARGSCTLAEKGGQVVAQVVETMRGINDSGRRIADIIGVIDGIAFQTNILALNAAVEAARAGEQGRGFAVVAGEVRLLAQRSAEAAKEIKSLITASVERVEQGTVLVDQAGATMNEVVASIHRVTDLIGEITAASSEQSEGVAQVGQAVNQMDQTTQQNAALVEESAAAAESLKQQAGQLVQTVAVFRLSANAAAAAA